MVFSSESQPVFLDTIPGMDAVVDKPSQTKAPTENTVSKTASKKHTVKRSPRLGVRTPQWRPGVHRPSPLGRYGRGTSSQRGGNSSGIGSTQDPVSRSTTLTGGSIVPNSAAMTMLQADEKSQVSDSPALTTSSKTNATVQPANKAKVERTEVSERKIQRGDPNGGSTVTHGSIRCWCVFTTEKENPEPEMFRLSRHLNLQTQWMLKERIHGGCHR